MNVFAIAAAQALSDERHDNSSDSRWILKGRAYEDVKVGDVLKLASMEVSVESIRTYGKETDLLSKMMTGELVVRLARGEQYFYLTS